MLGLCNMMLAHYSLCAWRTLCAFCVNRCYTLFYGFSICPSCVWWATQNGSKGVCAAGEGLGFVEENVGGKQKKSKFSRKGISQLRCIHYLLGNAIIDSRQITISGLFMAFSCLLWNRNISDWLSECALDPIASLWNRLTWGGRKQTVLSVKFDVVPYWVPRKLLCQFIVCGAEFCARLIL